MCSPLRAQPRKAFQPIHMTVSPGEIHRCYGGKRLTKQEFCGGDRDVYIALEGEVAPVDLSHCSLYWIPICDKCDAEQVLYQHYRNHP